MNKRQELAIIISCSIITLFLIQGRADLTHPLGPQAYETLHDSAYVWSTPDPAQPGTPYSTPTIITLLLHIIPMNPEQFLTLSIITTFLTGLILWKILAPLHSKQRVLTVLLFTISPLTLSRAYSATPFGFFFELLGILLLPSPLSALPFLAAASVNLVHLVVTFSLLAYLAYTQPKHRARLAAAGIVVFSLCAVLFSGRIIRYFSLPAYTYFQQGSLIADFGGVGVSLFLLVGIMSIFKDGKRWIAPLALLLYLSTYDRALLPYAALILAYFTAHTLITLYHHHYVLPQLKLVTLALLTLGILFSTASFVLQLTHVSPSANELHALEEIGRITDTNSVIFSGPEESTYLLGLGHSIMYPLRYQGALSETVNSTGYKLLHTYNLPYVADTLRIWNVTHVYITPRMTHLSVWKSPDKELHYLLKNKETFKKVYQDSGYELYEVRRPT